MQKSLRWIIMATFLMLLIMILIKPNKAPTSFEGFITLLLLFVNACYVIVSSEQLDVMSRQLRLDEDRIAKLLEERPGGSAENDQ